MNRHEQPGPASGGSADSKLGEYVNHVLKGFNAHAKSRTFEGQEISLKLDHQGTLDYIANQVPESGDREFLNYVYANFELRNEPRWNPGMVIPRLNFEIKQARETHMVEPFAVVAHHTAVHEATETWVVLARPCDVAGIPALDPENFVLLRSCHDVSNQNGGTLYNSFRREDVCGAQLSPRCNDLLELSYRAWIGGARVGNDGSDPDGYLDERQVTIPLTPDTLRKTHWIAKVVLWDLARQAPRT
jgi:hypothetical protein